MRLLVMGPTFVHRYQRWSSFCRFPGLFTWPGFLALIKRTPSATVEMWAITAPTETGNLVGLSLSPCWLGRRRLYWSFRHRSLSRAVKYRAATNTVLQRRCRCTFVCNQLKHFELAEFLAIWWWHLLAFISYISLVRHMTCLPSWFGAPAAYSHLIRNRTQPEV